MSAGRSDGDLDRYARSVANEAGYLFQLAVRDLVRRTAREHQWLDVSHEHAWARGDDLSGFVDLVLAKHFGFGAVVLVVECRRHGAPAWVFHAEGSAPDTARVRCWRFRADPVVGSGDQGGALRVMESAALDDFGVAPHSPESMFCVVKGEAERTGATMFERTAHALARATEAIAREMVTQNIERPCQMIRTLFIPMVVTSAPCAVLRFDAKDVDLASGKLPPDCGSVSTVPLIRFRKSLVTEVVKSGARSLAAANADRERTVLVAHARALQDTLAAFGADFHGHYE